MRHGVIRAVICDLDGTLADTETLYRMAFHRALMEFGVLLQASDYEQLVGRSTPARRAILSDMLGRSFPVDKFLLRYYNLRDVDAAVAKPGVEALLTELDRLALPRAIATSASSATAHRHLARLGLARRFDAVVTRDHVRHGKPAPDSFQQAANLLGISTAHCLAIEDSTPGVQAAVASGMMVVVVPDTLTPTYAMRYGCVAIAADLAEVASLIADSAMQPTCVDVRSRSRV